jgi:cyclic beta-1,2-glucan synthetase
MYRAGVESILGLKRHGGFLEITPCIPKSWPRYEMTYHDRSSRYEIVIENPHGVNQGIAKATLDGQPLAECSPLTARVALVNDCAIRQVHLTLGLVNDSKA